MIKELKIQKNDNLGDKSLLKQKIKNKEANLEILKKKNNENVVIEEIKRIKSELDKLNKILNTKEKNNNMDKGSVFKLENQILSENNI